MLLDSEILNKIRVNQQKFHDSIKNTPTNLQKEKFRREFQANASQVNNMQLNIETEGYQITLDQPKRSGGNERGPCPVSMMLGAFAACLEMDWIMLISLSNLNVEYVKVKITGGLDSRYALGGKQSPPPRMTKLTIQTIIKTTENHAKFDRLLQKVIRLCPVGGSLHPEIKKTYNIIFE